MDRRAFGTDRLETGDDGITYLSCRKPKPGWVARRKAAGVRRDFPGSCIRWGEEYFEVVDIDELQVGVRYALAAWDDSHTMRVVLDYDEESERRLEEEQRAERARRAKAAGFNAGALVTGLLPARVQEDLASEVGVSGARATLISCVIPFAIGFLSLISFIAGALGGGGASAMVLLPGVYFFVESLIRASVAMAQDKPIGSLPVVLVWEIIAVMRGRRPLRSQQPKLWEPDQATLDRDAFTQREPFLALLSAPEQRALAERYLFDWRARGRKSATALLVFAVFVVAITIPDLLGGRAGPGDFVTLLLMGYLIWEQIIRFQRIGRGEPAGSVLGALVRPFCRKLFR